MATDWAVEPRPGLFYRMMVPQRGGGASSLARGAAALGAVAFVISLMVDWRTVTVDLTENSGGSGSDPDNIVLHAGVANITSLSNAYLLGMIALLALVGATVGNTQLAARMRMPVLGLAVGIAAVVLSVFSRRAEVENAIGYQGGLGFLATTDERLTTAPGPGIFLAVVAIALCTASVFFGGRNAAIADAMATRSPDVDVEQYPVGEAEPNHRPTEYPQRLSTTPFEPRAGGVFDLTVFPDGQNPQR